MSRGAAAGTGLRVWRMQRVESIDANPRTFEQRAAAFAASVPDTGSITLLVARTETQGIVSQLVGPARLGDSGALALAQAVGAKAVPVARSDGVVDGLVPVPTGLVLPETGVVGWCERDPAAPVAHSVQAGANPAEVARLLAGSLQPGQWAAVVARVPRNAERKAWRRWMVHRLGTANPVHHSLSAKPLVVSLLAGGADVADVVSLLDQLVASLPGFDVGTRVRAGRLPSIRLGRMGVLAAGLAALFAVPMLMVLRPLMDAGVQALTEHVSEVPAGVVEVVGRVPVLLPLIFLLIGLGLIAVTLYRLRGHGLSWPVAAAGAVDGVFPRPRRAGRVRPPRAQQQPDHEGNGGAAAFDGDYPLHPAAFLVGPAVVAAVVAPQSGVLAGSAGTRDRGVPPAVLADIGPVIATPPGQADADGDRLVHLSAFDAGFGVAVTGGPGTGKTKLVEGLWLAATLDRVQPCRRPGWPGRNNTVIAFDTKGDEVPSYQRWADLAGDELTVVSVNDSSTSAIDIFALHPDPVRSAAMFVDAMVYAFDAGSIMGRSQETLTAVFAGALAADAQVCALVGDLGLVRHPVRLAHVLCGGAGETLAKELFGALRSEAVRRGDATMVGAVEKLKVIFEPFTSSAFRNVTEAARNKLDVLMKLQSWWDTDRPRLTWDSILEHHRSVVIDTGVGENGAAAGMVDERSGNLLAGLLMFGLWTAMKRTCAGWRGQNRWVSVFSDELAVQATHSVEPIGWMRDQGRSYGVRLCFATQRAEQLPQAVRDVFLTFPNLITFRQESVAAARSVAENVSQGDDVFTGDDIRNLAPFTAVARLDVNRRLVPSFVCSLHDFEADPPASIALLGYAPAHAGKPSLAEVSDPRTPGDDHRVTSPGQPRPATVFDDDDGVML